MQMREQSCWNLSDLGSNDTHASFALGAKCLQSRAWSRTSITVLKLCPVPVTWKCVYFIYCLFFFHHHVESFWTSVFLDISSMVWVVTSKILSSSLRITSWIEHYAGKELNNHVLYFCSQYWTQTLKYCIIEILTPTSNSPFLTQ